MKNNQFYFPKRFSLFVRCKADTWASVLTVETVEEHLRVRLNDEDEDVKKVVEAVPY